MSAAIDTLQSIRAQLVDISSEITSRDPFTRSDSDELKPIELMIREIDVALKLPDPYVAAIRTALGCFAAAEIEGLSDAVNATTDERLRDLLLRRVMHAQTVLQATGLDPDHGEAVTVIAEAPRDHDYIKPG